MMRERVITAAVGIPLVVAAIHYGYIPFLMLTLAIVTLGLMEYFALMKARGHRPFTGLGVAAGILLVTTLFLNGVVPAVPDRVLNPGIGFVISVLLILLVLRAMSRSNPEEAWPAFLVTAGGLFYVAWLLAHLMLLRELRPWGRPLTYFLFIAIWVMDTAAFVFGVRYGRRKLAQTLSAGKTWEGFFAGVAAAVVVALIFKWLVFKPFSITACVMMGLLVGILGPLGDLSESLVKRYAGVKDSGVLLPGHGGVLDRFDSFFFTAPILYYTVRVFLT